MGIVHGAAVISDATAQTQSGGNVELGTQAEVPGVLVVHINGGAIWHRIHVNVTKAGPLLPVGAGQQSPLVVELVITTQGDGLRDHHIDAQTGKIDLGKQLIFQLPLQFGEVAQADAGVLIQLVEHPEGAAIGPIAIGELTTREMICRHIQRGIQTAVHGDQAGTHRPVGVDAVGQARGKGDAGQLGGLDVAMTIPAITIIDTQTMAAKHAETGDPLVIDGMGQIDAAERRGLQRIAAVVAAIVQIQLEITVYHTAIDLQLGTFQLGHTGRVAGDGLCPLGTGGCPCVGQRTVGSAGFVEGKAASHC